MCKSILGNISGQTLIEMMIGLIVSLVIALGLGSLMMFGLNHFYILVEQNTAETELLKAAYALRIVGTQAVDLQLTATGAPGAGAAIPNNPGSGLIYSGLSTSTDNSAFPLVVNYAYDSLVDGQDELNDFTGGSGVVANAGVKRLMVFRREGGPAGVNMQSDFRPTGVFFRYPVACPAGMSSRDISELCSGALVVDVEASGAATVNAASNSSILFTHLSRLRMKQVTQKDNHAWSVEFILTARYFLAKESTLDFTCGGAACAGLRYVDSDMPVKVEFRNNYMAPSQFLPGQPERIHGSIYYFPFVTPKLTF